MENVLIVAHRGFSGIYPENTMVAFKKAVELKSDFVELDIRQTKDGKIVVIHDETIDRTTNGTGFIKDMTYKDIAKYDAGRWKNFSGEKIPLLEDVFKEVGDKIKILIEVKQCEIKKLINLIKKCKMEERVIVGSFNFEYLIQTRKLLPEVITALISWNIPENLNECIKYGIRKLDIEFHNLTKEKVKELMGKGFLVNTWTPDAENDLKQVLAFGVQFITTNFPDRLQKILSNICKNN